MRKKLYTFILLLFVVTICGCNKEMKKEPQTLIHNTKAPFTLYGSITLNNQRKTMDASALIKLQKLPLAGIFPVKNYLENQVSLSFKTKTTTSDSIQTNAKPNNNNTHVIIDASGFFTTFTTPPKNVAVLSSSYAQVWQDAGGTVT